LRFIFIEKFSTINAAGVNVASCQHVKTIVEENKVMLRIMLGFFWLKKKVPALFWGVSFLFFMMPSYAALDLELTQGVDSAVTIAVMPFLGEEASGDTSNIREVIGLDLKNSGKFKLADVANLLPVIGGKAGVNYEFWRTKKTEDLVIGEIKKIDSSNYRVSFQLIDVYNKAVLLDEQYKVPVTQLRSLAHHISNLIYEKLTGDRSVFATKIAYILVQRNVANQTKYQLEVADVDGHSPKTLLSSDQPLMSPAWSPDGKKIAYVSFEGNRAGIYQQDLATGQRQLISKHPGINGAPAWSPDGKKMALVLSTTGYPKIYVLDLGSNNMTQVTSDWYLDTEPSWDKDGRSIIFTSNRGGSPQIYRVYLESKKVERLTYKGNYNARASFTADGKNIVMLHQVDKTFNIALQNLESGRVTILTRTDFNESPSVAPNGKMIVYATSVGRRGVLAAVSSDGRVKLVLPAREGEVQEPAWSPFL